MNWHRLSPAAKAVFPVIACHCNKDGESFPGEEVIAALAGLTAKSVRKGIRDLEGFPGFTFEYYRTRTGRKGKKFQIEFPPREPGRAFFFFRQILDGGNWGELKPAAKALYPVMRYFSRYDVYEDDRLEDEDLTLDVPEHYADREYEICIASVEQMSLHAKINRHTVSDALKSLQDNFLIAPHTTGEKAWKVIIKPQTWWKASYLNKKLKTRAVA